MSIRKITTFIFWFGLSLFFCIESFRLGPGSFHAPGPGFFTFWTSLVIGLLVIVSFLQEMRKTLIKDVTPLFKGKNLRNVIYANGFLFGYAGMIDKIGFFLCTLFFIAFCLKVVGSMKWKIVILISFSVAIIVYMVFVYWLAIPLPEGKWVESLLAIGNHLWN